jgi:hypothetical protein
VGEFGGIGFDFCRRAGVGLGFGEFQKFRAVMQTVGELVERADDLLEPGAFLAELLRAIRVVPDARLLEFAGYFLEAFALVVVIKDTSSRTRCVPRDL